MTQDEHVYEKAGLALLILGTGIGLSHVLQIFNIDPINVGVAVMALSFFMIAYGRNKRQKDEEE